VSVFQPSLVLDLLVARRKPQAFEKFGLRADDHIGRREQILMYRQIER
jgi:hypothetical protein